MGLIDHLLHGGDDPAALLRDHPSVLLPKNAADDEVAGLLRAWSPTADTSGHGQEVIGGIRWYGPIPLDDKLIDAASLPSGFVEAYVARCHRSRALRSSASRRLFQWGQRFTDSRLGLDPTVTAETMADVEAAFPGGQPTGVEAHAWNLVRGIARSLGGIALLPENPGYTPSDDENPGAIVYAARALTPEEARPLLADLVPDLEEAADEELISTAGFWLLTSKSPEFAVVADVVEGEHLPPAVRALGNRLTAYDATADDDALEATVARRLVGATEGIVLDEFGFRRYVV